MDFLLKRQGTVFEEKRSRNGLGQKEVGDQLIIDVDLYKKHQRCKTLYCFVCDSEGRLTNPQGLEVELTKITDGLDVKVLVASRQYE